MFFNKQNKCVEKRIYNYKSHGPETGNCIKSDRGNGGVYVCEIRAWCPIELDILPMPKEPLLRNTDQFTVLIKNSISFPWFGADIYRRNNMPNGICKFDPNDTSSYYCPIFQLGDVVRLAGGIYELKMIKFRCLESIYINKDKLSIKQRNYRNNAKIPRTLIRFSSEHFFLCSEDFGI